MRVRNPLNTCLLVWLVLLALSVLVLSVVYVIVGYIVYKYAIVIDAGSSHCQVSLYKWKADKLNNTGLIDQVGTCSFHEPISGSNFTHTSEKMQECLHNMTSVMQAEAAYTRAEQTPVFLGATAGMRLMNMSQPARTGKILTNLTQLIANNHRVGRVSIISGRHEGLYAWIAVNYIKRTLLPGARFIARFMTRESTYGILDMGGASAQIAHQIESVSHNETDDSHVNVRLYGQNYTVSTFSNLCFGVEQAISRHLIMTLRGHILNNPGRETIDTPCLAYGVSEKVSEHRLFNNCTQFVPSKHLPWKPEYSRYEFVGTSNFEQCYETVSELLDHEECDNTFRHCFKQSSHPKKGMKFYAVSAYYYTTIMMRNTLGENVAMGDFIDFTRHICRLDKGQLERSTSLDFKYVKKYCFQQIYIYLTLQRVYHFDNESWSNIIIAKEIDRTHLGWALGYIIEQTNAIPSESPRHSIISTPSYVITIIILGLCFFLLVAFLLHRRHHRNLVGSTKLAVEETTSLNMITK